ncbi:MAG: cell envelope integrity protein TolA [Hydrogenophaga sp.]
MNRQSPYPLPEPGGSWGLPTALALLVHALLVVALTWGVSWKQTSEPVLDAELWSALPQVAAPALVEPPTEAPTEPQPEPEAPEPEPEPKPAPPPPPPPPAVKAPSPAKPDIVAQKKAQDEQKAKEQAAKDKAAKEKESKDRAAKDKAAKDLQAKKKLAEDKAKKDKAAKDKAAKEQEAKEKAEKDQAAADAKRREAQRKEQIDRMLGQAGGQGNAAGNAAANSGPSASYGGRVAASIKPNVVLADPISGNPRAEVEVRADADGKIVSRRLVKSSGNPTWDQAVLRAIDRTGTLPRDTDGRVPSALIIGLRPQD